MLVAAGVLLGLSTAATANDLVYRRTLTIGSDGQMSEEFSGTPVYVLSNGRSFTVSAADLEAPDGTRFGIDWDISQSDEREPVVAIMEVWRRDIEKRSVAARVSEYEVAHPGQGAATYAAYAARLEAAASVVHERSIDSLLLAKAEAAGHDEPLWITVVLADQPELEVPTVAVALADEDPAAVLDQLEERILAIEDRRTELSASQEDILREISADGGDSFASYWLVNAFSAREVAMFTDAQ